MKEALEFVVLDRVHLEGGLLLSQAAGWPHRAEDWAMIFAVSRGIAAVEDGKVKGVGFCTIYGDDARLNMIIVDEAMRGRGIGRRVVDNLIAIADGRPMGLVATADGFPLYRKLGFEPAGQIEQLQGVVTQVPSLDTAVRFGSEQDLQSILSFDRAATGLDRTDLLKWLITHGKLFVSDDGYAILRDFGRGQVVGPLIARDANAAASLLATAAQGLEGKFLRVDTDPAFGLVPSIGGMGLTSVGGGTTMYAGKPPQTHDFINFALVAQALG